MSIETTAASVTPDGSPGTRFAVVGSPIAHSLSPILHRTAYRVLGVDGARYERYDVAAGELASFLTAGAGQELHGLSVTMPGKPEAFSLASATDATSRDLAVSNTLIRRADGTWRAENHDVYGIVAALRGHGADAPGTGAVLGSGATAVSAVAALIELGVDQILLSARSPQKLSPLTTHAARAGVPIRIVPWELNQELLTAEVVISALAVDGARAVSHAWEQLPGLTCPDVFFDVIYDPWPAPLAELLAPHGGVIVDGLEMLTHQADMQIRSMLGVPAAPVREMLTAARAELSRRAAARDMSA